MRIEQLEHLIYVAETGSLTQAAKYFYMSQQAVSYSIQKLEKELNIKILRRRNMNKVLFTDAGELVLATAKNIISEYKELQRNLKPLQNPGVNKVKLHLYINPFMASTLLPKIYKKIGKEFDNIQLIILEKNRSALFDYILNPGETDKIGLVSMSDAHFTKEFEETFHFEPIYSTKVLALIEETSPLNSFQSININELLEYPIIIFSDDPNDNIFAKSLSNNIILQSNNIHLCRQLLKEKMAISFTTEYTESFFSIPGLITKPIKDALMFHVGFIWENNNHLSPEVEDFISITKEVLNHHFVKSNA